LSDKLTPNAIVDLGYAQGGNVTDNPYDEPPGNNADNDAHQGHTAGRDGQSYTWGKVSPRFSNQGAEITPHHHNEVTPRKLAHGGGCSCWRCGGRFARGGQAQAQLTAPWRERFNVEHKSNGLKIHAPHSGEGLVMNIHLSPVGQHAISFHSVGDYSGAVDQARMVQRAAERRLASAARPTPFPMPNAPQLGSQASPAGGFGQMLCQGQAPGMSAWNAEGATTLARMP
jgi:hypothetical protein